jgi:hypothetical protein
MITGNRASRFLALAVSVGLLALAAAFAACGGDDDDEATPTQSTTEEPTASEAPDASEPVVVQVGETFWHSGFKVTLDQATYAGTEDDLGTVDWTVEIDATFENLGPDTDSFDAEMVLLAGGETWTEISSDSDVPSVPGELLQDGTIIFIVDDTFDFEEASLLVGSADQNQASIPLGPDAADLIALEPESAAVTGQIALELITLDFDGAEVRADIPLTHDEMDDGKLHLTIDFEATSRKSGNWSVNVTDFALTLPDGTSVPDYSGNNVSLPGNASGTTTGDLFVGFEVDDPAAGEYTLRFTAGSWWIENGPGEGEFIFTID